MVSLIQKSSVTIKNDIFFSVISSSESSEWDKIVKSFENHDVYHLSAYTKAFEIHGDGEALLFYYKDSNIKAINVVMKKDISLDSKFHEKIPSETYFDISTPYGYGGFLIEGNEDSHSIRQLNEIYTTYCKEKGIISEFVRFHPLLNNKFKVKSMYDVRDLGKTITMDLTSKEEIWNQLSSKNRNVIRKSLKSNVEIHWGKERSLIKKFMELYNETMDRDQAKSYYYFNDEFYESLINDMKYNMLIFYAMYQGEIISMSMIIFSNKKMHYHLSASNREFQHLAATNLLLYEAACWGYETGLTKFHLGGGLGSAEDNLFKFKKAFNKESETFFSIGKKIFDTATYKMLLELKEDTSNTIMDKNHFPEYRG